MEHIGNLDYKLFYKDCFSNENEYVEFYEKIKTCDNAPKMFHQTARIISLADQLGGYIYDRPAINMLFYIMTAELVAKLYHNFNEDGQSKKYVKKFFVEFTSNNNKTILENSIKKNNVFISLDEVVEFFYKIRCDVVHEGNYYKYSFQSKNTSESSINIQLPKYEVIISIEDVRNIIIDSSINAIKMLISD